jgi:hypothetical protein
MPKGKASWLEGGLVKRSATEYKDYASTAFQNPEVSSNDRRARDWQLSVSRLHPLCLVKS